MLSCRNDVSWLEAKVKSEMDSLRKRPSPFMRSSSISTLSTRVDAQGFEGEEMKGEHKKYF